MPKPRVSIADFMVCISGHTAAECEGVNREALGGNDPPVIDLIIAVERKSHDCDCSVPRGSEFAAPSRELQFSNRLTTGHMV